MYKIYWQQAISVVKIVTTNNLFADIVWLDLNYQGKVVNPFSFLTESIMLCLHHEGKVVYGVTGSDMSKSSVLDHRSK